MPTAPPRDAAATITVHEQFIDLLCADEQLLRAEFDAIIAAEWLGPPAEPDGGSFGGDGPGSAWCRRAGSEPALSRQPRRAGTDRSGRQRSPPALRDNANFHRA